METQDKQSVLNPADRDYWNIPSGPRRSNLTLTDAHFDLARKMVQDVEDRSLFEAPVLAMAITSPDRSFIRMSWLVKPGWNGLPETAQERWTELKIYSGDLDDMSVKLTTGWVFETEPQFRVVNFVIYNPSVSDLAGSLKNLHAVAESSGL